MSDTISEEIYDLRVGRDGTTGKPRWLTVRLGGKLQSPPDDRPAWIVYDSMGRPTLIAWYHENLYHRATGPALQRIDPETQIITYEEHRLHGRIHRPLPEPALIVRDPGTGAILQERFFVDDQEVFPRRPTGLDLSP